MKYHEEVLSLQPMIPPTKRFDIFPPSDWGMLRRSRLRLSRFFLNNNVFKQLSE